MIQPFGEDRLEEQFLRIGMDQIGPATADQDAIGIGIGPDGGNRLGKPLERHVEREGTDKDAVGRENRFAVGDDHAGIHHLVVGLFEIVVGLRPAGLLQQPGHQVPIQVKILVAVIAFLLPEHGVIRSPIGKNGVVPAFFRIEIRLERDGTAVEDRVVPHDLVGVFPHLVGIGDIAEDEPLEIVGGNLHVFENAVHAQDRVVQHLLGAAFRLLAGTLARLGEDVIQCCQHQDTEQQGQQDAQAGRERAPYEIRGGELQFHGRISSILIGRFSIPLRYIRSEA